MSGNMQVRLSRIGEAHFEARHPSGERMVLEGPPDLGGSDQYFRPMETVLISLAGCAAVDILHIAKKSRKELKSLEVDVAAKRAEAIPAVFEHIELLFQASGEFNQAWLQRAADLSMEKYCSVARMLAPSVQISHQIAIIDD